MSDFSDLCKDADSGTCSSREPGDAESAALLRLEPGVRADRDASGPAAAVGRAPGGGSDRGVPLRDQAEPVHPCPGAEDLLRRDAVRDRHRRGRMLPVQGVTRCVSMSVGRIYLLKTTIHKNRKRFNKHKQRILSCKTPNDVTRDIVKAKYLNLACNKRGLYCINLAFPFGVGYII